MKKSITTIILSVIFSVAAVFAVLKTDALKDKGFTGTASQTVTANPYRTVNLAQTEYPDFTLAAESAVDAVVYVKVSVKTNQQYTQDPFYRFFFGEQAPQEQQGSGSGVIIREDGYIVTNNHVVESASKVEVTLNNNRTFPATVVGTDPATDVALLKIDAAGLPVVKFANSDEVRLGEWVLAIGSPYDLRSTITAGIISAKGRNMPNYDGKFKIESFLQTDAAVNPGNSGGALVNKKGELVGVNTAIISQTGQFAGYSFAIPSNIVRKIVGDLIDFGSVRRATLGVSVSQVSEETSKEMKLSSPQGVYINEVTKGGSADKAGIKKGDVIIALDSTDIHSVSALQEKVNSYHPGDNAVAEVVREGKHESLKIQFIDGNVENGTVADDGTVAFYGATIKAASKETLSRLGLKNGVEIVSVGPGKMMEAGACEGFIIQYVNDQPVSKPQDVLDAARKSKRAVFIEGMTTYGRAGVFGFGKDE